MKDFKIVTLAIGLGLMTGCGTWLGNPSDAPGSGSGGSTPPKDRQDPIASTGPDSQETNKVDEAPTVINIDFDDPVGGITSDQVAFALDISIPNGEMTGSLSLDSAQAVISSIVMKDTVNNETVTFEGPFLVDLIKNSVQPQPEPQEIKPGTYDTITFKTLALSENDNLTTDESLLGNSLDFNGQLTIGETSSPFIVALPMEIGFEISPEVFPDFPGIVVEKGQTNQVNIDLQFPLWFKNAKIDVSTPQALLRTVTSTLETVSKLLMVNKKSEAK